MTDFRGPLPLRDSDFAEVRREVLAKLERRPIAPIVIRFALATAAVIALVFIFLPRAAPPPRRTPVSVPKTVPGVAQTILSAPGQARVPAPHKDPTHKRRRTPEQHMASTGGPPSDSDITMNIQTADPNVRIIWIVQR
jgi:hypothetical protein